MDGNNNVAPLSIVTQGNGVLVHMELIRLLINIPGCTTNQYAWVNDGSYIGYGLLHKP